MSYFKSFSALTASLLLCTILASTALAGERSRTTTNSQGGSVTQGVTREDGVTTRTRTVTDADGNSRTRTESRPSRRGPQRRR